MNFSERSCKKCHISRTSTRNHRFRQHYATFRTNYHVFAFRWTFKEKVRKSGSFREKARKIMALVKTCNFSNKLPCFYVSMNFSANSCKSCLISWESTKIHRFGQNYATFSNKLPCFGVAMNFSGRGSKKWLNSLKSTKNHRFGQNFATFRTTSMSLDFDQLFRKKLQRVPHYVKKHEKWSIWPNLFKTPKHGSLLEKLLVFSKKWLISRKRTKNHPFGQNLQLFEETTMFRRFGQLFSNKLQKVAYFEKMHEKSSILPKLATFRENYHVSAFWWTFQQKVAKTGSFRQKARKIIDMTKAWNFSMKLPCLSVLVNFSAKRWKKWLIS